MYASPASFHLSALKGRNHYEAHECTGCFQPRAHDLGCGLRPCGGDESPHGAGGSLGGGVVGGPEGAEGGPEGAEGYDFQGFPEGEEGSTEGGGGNDD